MDGHGVVRPVRREDPVEAVVAGRVQLWSAAQAGAYGDLEGCRVTGIVSACPRVTVDPVDGVDVGTGRASQRQPRSPQFLVVGKVGLGWLEAKRAGDLLPVDGLGLGVPRDAPASAGASAGRDLAVGKPVVDGVGGDAPLGGGLT